MRISGILRDFAGSLSVPKRELLFRSILLDFRFLSKKNELREKSDFP